MLFRIIDRMTTEEYETIAIVLRPRLISVGQKFFTNDDMAEDVAQEVLTRLWVLRSKIDMRQGVDAFAIRMAKNICISEWRRQKLHKLVDINESLIIQDYSPVLQIENSDNEKSLRKAIGRLSKPEQRLFRMRHELDMDIQQIAVVTGIQPRSISAMLSGARKKIMEILKKGGNL